MVNPICLCYPSCSGCSLQRLDYAQQLENKKKNIVKLLNWDKVIVFSDQPLHYRNRLEFLFHSRGLGLRKKDGPSDIIDINHCPIALPRINELLSELRTTFSKVDAFNLRTKKGLFRFAVIRATKSGDSSISFVLNEDASRRAEAIEQIKSFADKTTACNILISFVPATINDAYSSEYIIIKGKDFLKEELFKRVFYYPVQGFFQNNSVMAEKMLEYVNSLFKKYNSPEKELLDLYSGVGTFGLTNSSLFKKVILVENAHSAIDFAKMNITENKIKNASAYALQAHQLGRINFSKELIVIADPPRTGMDQKTIVKLNSLKPAVIIYVSCNPSQLAKDIAKFKNYTLNSVALFDLFPQTAHSEVVAELNHKSL